MKRSLSPEEARLKAEFEQLREILHRPEFRERLDRSLAFWTLPNDRRLPFGLLDWSVHEILAAPYESLASTSGIGVKKLASLNHLLKRATQEQPPLAPISASTAPSAPKAFGSGQPEHEQVDSALRSTDESADEVQPIGADGKFDPSLVSEALWSIWQETVLFHNLANERLGRLAPTLMTIPSVIWRAPLGSFVNQSLAEIRGMRTYGEKRIRGVLEVFYLVHKMLSRARPHYRVATTLSPSFVPPLNSWFAEMLNRSRLPSAHEIREQLVLPLVAQLDIDLGDMVSNLVRGRLGVDGTPQSVQSQAKQHNLTRARIYQLLEECAEVMEVRWTEGRFCFDRFAARLEREAHQSEATILFQTARELFYPRKLGPPTEQPVADESLA